MEISILAVGRLKSGPEAELVSRYLQRAEKSGRQQGFRGFAVSEIAEGRGARAQDRMAEEGEGILAWTAGSPFTCLHEQGDLATSDAFAAWLRAEADRGAGRLAFVIGGPDGLERPVLAAAARTLSFGRMTWPHQLVRVMLAEQFYRAMTILAGHPYHRA